MYLGENFNLELQTGRWQVPETTPDKDVSKPRGDQAVRSPMV